jgi:Uma2 family endonuclease
MADAPAKRWTLAELVALPDDPWIRYELIDGELHVAKAPGDDHCTVQLVCGGALGDWSLETGLGRAMTTPGVIFSEGNSVIPDIIWLSHERYAAIRGPDRHLHGAPELIVEVLSPGAANERRDREAKLRLYSRFGVAEYWIIDLRARAVDVYRQQDGALRLAATVGDNETLTSPLLPGFALPLARLFAWL